MNRLSVIEAERVIAILEDTTEKLSFLDSITPDILQHRDELSKFIGDEIARTMSEQNALEKRYERLIEQRSAMKGMVNKSKYKEIQEDIQDVSRALRESTNNLVRSLKENPNVSGNMIKVQRDRTELHDLLIRCVQELRDRGTFHTITHKVDEENNSRLRLQQLRAREKSLREIVIQLERQLLQEQSSFKRTTSEQRLAISHLKDELQIVKGSTSTDARFKRKESLASVSAIWREYKLKERVIETRLKDLEDKLQTEHVVNNETKDFLIRKQAALAEDISMWETRFDREVGEMDAATRHMAAQQNRLREKLQALQTRKKVEIQKEKERRDSQELEEERSKQQAARLRKQNRAAKTIQREMLSYMRRKKELENINKESKKNKKEKGGKSKKK